MCVLYTGIYRVALDLQRKSEAKHRQTASAVSQSCTKMEHTEKTRLSTAVAGNSSHHLACADSTSPLKPFHSFHSNHSTTFTRTISQPPPCPIIPWSSMVARIFSSCPCPRSPSLFLWIPPVHSNLLVVRLLRRTIDRVVRHCLQTMTMQLPNRMARMQAVRSSSSSSSSWSLALRDVTSTSVTSMTTSSHQLLRSWLTRRQTTTILSSLLTRSPAQKSHVTDLQSPSLNCV